MSNNRRYKAILLVVGVLLSVPYRSLGADANPEWERVVGTAKKEGKVVIGAPPGTDFRNEVQGTLKKRFNLDSEFVQAPGPNLMSKIVAEKQAGAVSVDVFLIGPCTGNSLLKADLFEPLAPAMVLPEVKDPAKWFGGHLWADNQTGKNLCIASLRKWRRRCTTTHNGSSLRTCAVIAICSIPSGKEKSASEIHECRAAVSPCGHFSWT